MHERFHGHSDPKMVAKMVAMYELLRELEPKVAPNS